MNVIISNYPEDLEVPQEYVANVTAAAQKVGELYGVENGEVGFGILFLFRRENYVKCGKCSTAGCKQWCKRTICEYTI